MSETISGMGPKPGSVRIEAFGGQLSTRLDDWLAVELDGTIRASSGKVELGTGVRTALAQIVAEELDVPFERVHMVMGDTGRTPDEGYTAGSMTILMSGGALRKAAAEARRALLEAAAEALDAGVEELEISSGEVFVTQRPERRASYAALMGGKRFDREVSGTAPLKPPEGYQVVGRPVPRVDIPAKAAGQPSFITDVQVPGMLHARLVRPPGPGAVLESVDESSLAGVPGLVKLVVQGNFIGVIAEREEQAVQAARQLKVSWREPAVLPRMEDLYSLMRAQPAEEKVLVEQGDLQAALGQSPRRIRAAYLQPYHAHASIGPSCAVADARAEGITVWSSTSGPHPLRIAMAQLAGVAPEKIHIIHVEGAGSYGQNGADDAAADAVVLSQSAGQPVRLQWSREDEFAWEPYGPAMVMEVEAGLDGQGNITAWDYHVWSPSHVARARFAGQLVAAQLRAGLPHAEARFSLGAERNAPTNYAFPAQRVTLHSLPTSILRASAFRSLGGGENTFANESFIDELAAAAGADAVEYRLRYLSDPRCREVLTAAAEAAGWDSRTAPRPGNGERLEGRGVAFARYENEQAIVACVARVEVNPREGTVSVRRIVVAHDCGLIINPDGVRNQIEGNIIQSLSRTLKEEVKFSQTRILSVDWESYPILTFSEVPEVEIVLLNRPDQPALGAGEPSTVTTAAAVANAIFDATGVRLRQIPFTPTRIKSLIEEMNL